MLVRYILRFAQEYLKLPRTSTLSFEIHYVQQRFCRFQLYFYKYPLYPLQYEDIASKISNQINR